MREHSRTISKSLKNGFGQATTSSMKTTLDFEKQIHLDKIENELDLERALAAFKRLRVMAEENEHFETLRKKLGAAIHEYEQKYWSNSNNITDEQVCQSDKAQMLVEQEEAFIYNRKTLIRSMLKSLNLTQQDLGEILGHSSKTYMSELVNGICPFSLKDLVIIHKVLKISMDDLVPVFLTESEQVNINTNLIKLNNRRTNSKLQTISI
jgi:antitoxin component HigA of HigAB toxin-antitoxin module